MQKRAGPSLESLWEIEDRFTALAGSPIGKVRTLSKTRRDRENVDVDPLSGEESTPRGGTSTPRGDDCEKVCSARR